jgi:hypothetical protein
LLEDESVVTKVVVEPVESKALAAREKAKRRERASD